MDRLTKTKEDKNFYVPVEYIQLNDAGYTGDAVNKLAKFENVYDGLMARQNEISKELEGLRSEGKTRTVKFKQLLTEKLMNNNIIMIFQNYGL